jgi:hypothetical protein
LKEVKKSKKIDIRYHGETGSSKDNSMVLALQARYVLFDVCMLGFAMLAIGILSFMYHEGRGGELVSRGSSYIAQFKIELPALFKKEQR